MRWFVLRWSSCADAPLEGWQRWLRIGLVLDVLLQIGEEDASVLAVLLPECLDEM